MRNFLLLPIRVYQYASVRLWPVIADIIQPVHNTLWKLSPITVR